MLAFAAVACNANSRNAAEPVVRRFLIACIGQLPKETTMTMTKHPTDATKVVASKENAQFAQKILTEHGNRVFSEAEHGDLVAFVSACVSRLPTQAAIERERKRKRGVYEKRSAKKKPAAKAKATSGTETFRTGPHAGNGTEVPRGAGVPPADTARLPDLTLDVDAPETRREPVGV